MLRYADVQGNYKNLLRGVGADTKALVMILRHRGNERFVGRMAGNSCYHRPNTFVRLFFFCAFAAGWEGFS